MARIRTIKPEFAVSETLAECSVNSRLLFAIMWCFCDDGGVHPDSARRLKMECFPADDFTADQVGMWVDELVNVDCLMRYEVDGISFLRVTHWETHQKIDQPTYRYPREDGKIPPSSRRKFADNSANVHLDDGGRSPPEGKGREGKGGEKKERKIGGAEAQTDLPFSFLGKIIRLSQSDYDDWKRTYCNVPDFEAELMTADCYYSENPPKNGKWFFPVSSWLKRCHEQNKPKPRFGL